MATDAAGERGGDARDRARRWAAVSQAEGQRFPSSSKWKVTDVLDASVSSFVKSGAGADGGGRGMPDSGLQGETERATALKPWSGTAHGERPVLAAAIAMRKVTL